MNAETAKDANQTGRSPREDLWCYGFRHLPSLQARASRM